MAKNNKNIDRLLSALDKAQNKQTKQVIALPCVDLSLLKLSAPQKAILESKCFINLLVIIYLPKNYAYKSLFDGFKEYTRIIDIDKARIKTIIVVTEYGKFAVFNEQDFEEKTAYWIEKIKVLKK